LRAAHPRRVRARSGMQPGGLHQRQAGHGDRLWRRHLFGRLLAGAGLPLESERVRGHRGRLVRSHGLRDQTRLYLGSPHAKMHGDLGLCVPARGRMRRSRPRRGLLASRVPAPVRHHGRSGRLSPAPDCGRLCQGPGVRRPPSVHPLSVHRSDVVFRADQHGHMRSAVLLFASLHGHVDALFAGSSAQLRERTRLPGLMVRSW